MGRGFLDEQFWTALARFLIIVLCFLSFVLCNLPMTSLHNRGQVKAQNTKHKTPKTKNQQPLSTPTGADVNRGEPYNGESSIRDL